MPKRKHQQQDAAGGRSGGSKPTKSSKANVKPVTLPNLFTLPEEIGRIILSHVCSKQGGSSSSKWKVDPDLNMMRSLVLVSKQFYDYFSPLLYAHVRIDTPSALRQFHAALHSRPANAARVKSIHLGPLKTLDEKFWPVRMKEEDEEPFQADEPMVIFKTGLSTKDEKLRPRGIKADKEFRYEEGNSRADKVLRQAFEELDVEPYDGCYFEDTQGNFIGIVEWTKRIFWIQGILDIYLAKMRELEDAKERSEASRVTHPRLVLEGFVCEKSSSQDAPAPSGGQQASAKGKGSKGKKVNSFVVTPEQVEDFWLRPGSYTDSFDHPLYFTEPGLRYLARNVFEQVIVDPADIEPRDYRATETGGKQTSLSREGSEQKASPVSSDRVHQEEPPCPSDSECSPRSSPKSGPPTTTSPISPSGRLTRDNLLTLGSTVLGLTTNVKNLSLSGIFHEKSELAVLGRLRYLSIGPLTPPQNAALCLEEWKTMLPALEKLHVCGGLPSIGAALLIGGEVEGLPRLQEAVWDFGHTKTEKVGGSSFLWKLANIMRGASEAAGVSPSKEKQAAPCRYVEFRVHSTYVNALLDMASEPEIRAALANGQPASDAQRSLRIMKSGAQRERDSWYSPPQQFDVLYREGQEWWKERALELERS